MNEQIDFEYSLGYKQKSFSLPYNGGEIWFEHLDGFYDNEEFVLKKLKSEIPEFSRSSVSSYICFVLNETMITDCIFTSVMDSILNNTKHFMKIAFTGLNMKNKNKFKHELKKKGFVVEFFDSLEDAKEWLLP